MTKRNEVRIATAVVAALALGACGKPQPLGDRNAVILGLQDAEWPAIQQDVQDVLEPTAFAVHDERIFRVTQVDPQGPHWGDTRRFRNVVVVGEPGDEWVAEALRSARAQPASLPALVEASNVWARGQRVYALVLAPGSNVTAVRPLLPEVLASLVAEYEIEVRQRMFASGVDEGRVAEVEREGGFRILAPNVYRVQRLDETTFRFLNDQPDPSRLQRSVLVTYDPGRTAPPEAEQLLDWREEVAGRHYEPAQTTLRDRVEHVRPENAAATQVQGTWSSVPGAWPAGGPFITRSVACPDGRTYLIDAWLYAPGREKYEYMFQLNTILDSFSCAGANAP